MKKSNDMMLRKARIYWLAAVLFLSACSTLTELRQDFADRVFGREPPNPPAELEDIKPTYIAKVDWSAQTGETEKYDYTPAMEAGAVYMANAEGELTKLDVANGHQLWRVNVGERVSGGVGVGGGVVMVGTAKGNVLAYDYSGKELWKAKVSSEVLSAPRYFDGVVIARAGNSQIFGLDAANGERKWIYERAMPALTLRNSAGLVVDGGAIYAGFPGGKMAAIRADNGKLIWEATVAQPKGVTEIERIADITSVPFVDGPLVYAVAYQGKIAAVDRRTGKVVWNRDISSYTGLSAEDARIFVSHTLGSVYALDYTNGRTYWRQGALANRRLSAPVPMGNVIAVGDLEGYVHFLSREDGAFAARLKTDSNAVMAMIPGNSGSQVIIATRGGGLYAVSVTAMPNRATSGTTNADSEGEGSGARRPLPYYGDVPTPVPASQPKSDPAPAINSDKSELEKTIIEKVEPTPEAPSDAGANTDSILFKKDPLAAPDAGALPGTGSQ